MRQSVLAVALIALLAIPAVGAREDTRGPILLAGTTWPGGTLLTWAPSDEAGASYNVYMGGSLDSLAKIAHTLTPFYHVTRETRGVVYFAVTTVVEGIESNPTVLKSESDSEYSCLTMNMNGSVGVKPDECVP